MQEQKHIELVFHLCAVIDPASMLRLSARLWDVYLGAA